MIKKKLSTQSTSKRSMIQFQKEWVMDNYEKKLPYSLIDGNFQSSYYFALIEEFEIALKDKIPLTLGTALLSAIEQAGRDILRYKNPSKYYFDNRKCFDEFLLRYMGYKKIKANRYDIFRSGVIHSGLPKNEGPALIGIDTHPNFLKQRGINSVRGLHIHRDGLTDITLSILLDEFEIGIRKMRWHEIKYHWGEID